MKVLHISLSDLSRGGATVAAYRLHCGLNEQGVDSWMLVQKKMSTDKKVIDIDSFADKVIRYFKTRLGRLPLKFYRDRKRFLFTTNLIGADHFKIIEKLKPDLIHLHWVGNEMASLKWLDSVELPIVWTMHDMWPFTGGCHYSFTCERFKSTCGKCPMLGSKSNNDLSSYLHKLKIKYVGNKIDAIISPSDWLANMIKSSAVFMNQEVSVIPYGVNTDLFKPLDQAEVRRKINLPVDKFILLFGAYSATSNPFKGWDLVVETINKLSRKDNTLDFLLVVFGNKELNLKLDVDIPVKFLGPINNEASLAEIYNCADLFIVPSIQDNLPNVIIEAMACSIPCVAFNVGGIPEIISDQQNGFLIDLYDTSKMANVILDFASNMDQQIKYKEEARNSVMLNYDSTSQVERYISIYRRNFKC